MCRTLVAARELLLVCPFSSNLWLRISGMGREQIMLLLQQYAVC